MFTDTQMMLYEYRSQSNSNNPDKLINVSQRGEVGTAAKALQVEKIRFIT